MRLSALVTTEKAQLSLRALCRLGVAGAGAYSLRRQAERTQRLSGSFYRVEKTQGFGGSWHTKAYETLSFAVARQYESR